MKVADLKKIWEPDAQGKITQLEPGQPEWPDQPLTLYGAGSDSGTFDYFTEAVVGKAKASRGDYTASEDDNVLVQGIEGDTNALGYIPFAYCAPRTRASMKVARDRRRQRHVRERPARQTVQDGTYTPALAPALHLCQHEGARRSRRSRSSSSST